MKLSFVLITLVAASSAFANVDKGLEIFKKVDAQDNGFVNSTADLEMLLKNRQGKVSTRFIRNRTLEVPGDGDKSLVIFDRPRDVKGTAFLSFTHKTGPDDQWLYLPALRRTKRIASNNKAGPFMGSEFAFEDISSQEVEKYTYKFIKDENCEATKVKCHVVERYPVDKKSGYSKQVVWVNEKELRIEKIVFYDRKGSKLKTLEYRDYKKYLDQFWRAGEMFMVNHQKGKETTLKFTNYKFKTALSGSDFNKNALKRVK